MEIKKEEIKNKLFEKDNNGEEKFKYKMIDSFQFKEETLTEEEIINKIIHLEENCSYYTLLNKIKLAIETDGDYLSDGEIIDMICEAIKTFEELKLKKLYQ